MNRAARFKISILPGWNRFAYVVIIQLEKRVVRKAALDAASMAKLIKLDNWINSHFVVKSPFDIVDSLFQILVWWVTISDWPFSLSRYLLLYSQEAQGVPASFLQKADAIPHDSYSDKTFFYLTVPKQVSEVCRRRDGITLLVHTTRNGAADI